MTLDEMLVELRMERGLSQEELAAAARISVRAISDLERGATRRPQRATLRALASALKLSDTERDRLDRAARQVPPTPPARRPAVPPGLPAPLTTIVGRDDEVRRLAAAVRGGARLVTVTGPGGVGKSRLALEVGWRLAPRFARTAAVDLSGLTDPENLIDAIGAAVGCRPDSPVTTTTVVNRVGGDRWLLLLDSFEHVAEAASLLTDLLAACAGLTLLVTSRGPLRLRAEQLWPLAPLPLPDPGADLAELAANPTVDLFVARARAVRPGFALTAADAAPVTALCRQTSGLPLAVELTAAHLLTRDPATLANEVAAGSTDGPAAALDVADRHHSLTATVRWSTDRMRPEDRVLFAVLGVFRGGALPASAAAVAARAGLPAGHLDASLAALAAAGLVSVDHRGRVVMLDAVADVAGDLLAASGTETPVRRAHSGHMLDLARRDPRAADVAVELDNIRVALRWAVGHRAEWFDAPTVAAVADVFGGCGRYADAHRYLVAIADAVPDPGVAAVATMRAGVAIDQHGDHATAARLAERARSAFAALDHAAGQCGALMLLGNAEKAVGRYRAADVAFQECLRIGEAHGVERVAAVAFNNIGSLAINLGDYPRAEEYFTRSLAIKEAAGDARGALVARTNLGIVASDDGRPAEAVALLEPAVAQGRAEGDRFLEAFGTVHLAHARLALGDVAAAGTGARAALKLAGQVDSRQLDGMTRIVLGDVALAAGAVDEAEEHYRRAYATASELTDTVRILDRLAVVTAGRDGAGARRLLAEADELRRAHGIVAPVPDRALTASLRAGAPGATGTAAPTRDTVGPRRSTAT